MGEKCIHTEWNYVLTVISCEYDARSHTKVVFLPKQRILY